jgi:effector-binding domain-containing protein
MLHTLDAPQIVQTAAQATAVIHLTVPRVQIQEVMGAAVAEILAALAAQAVPVTGPMYSYHLRRPSDTFDFEVGFAIGAPFAPGGGVTTSRLPAATVARASYRGAYEGLGAAWAELLAWVQAQGLAAQPGLWERYVRGPESGADPAQWITELNRPLVAAGAQRVAPR